MNKILSGSYIILSESTTPLTSQQLARELLERKLWTSTGKTPDATVGAQIYTEIKKKGANALFIKAGKNLFSINPNAKIVAPLPLSKRNANDSGKQKKNRKVSSHQTVTTPTFSFLDSAERVLKADAARKPMHYEIITQRAIKYGWLISNGLTPEASMSAQIYTDIKKCESQGRRSRFTMNKGMVGLTEWSVSTLEKQIEQHNEDQRKKLLDKVKCLTPGDFERLITTLLPLMGFSSAEQTQYTRDHGVDVRGTLIVHESINIKLAVQAKRWKDTVAAPVVQALRGSLKTDERGLIVTTSNFSDGAKKEAARTDAHAPIDLINGKQLVDLLVAYNLGVTKNRYQLLQLTNSFFENSESDDNTN